MIREIHFALQGINQILPTIFNYAAEFVESSENSNIILKQ